jgi:hypothetical protein
MELWMRVLKPKYVKKANNWCITVIREETKDKPAKQEQFWFSTEKQAEYKYLELKYEV